jgi:hypothetical protein
MSLIAKLPSSVYEEPGDFERRVEFDMRRHTTKEAYTKDIIYRAGSPPAQWTRREPPREREKRDAAKERERKDPIKVKEPKKDTGKEREVMRKEGLREIRKGLPPPTSVLHGYKYPIQHPKSILKRPDIRPSQQVLSEGVFSSGSLELMKGPPELSFFKPAKQPLDRQKGITIPNFIN